VTPIDDAADAGLAMAFDIAVGVRREGAALAAEIDRALNARRAEIDRILDAWGVPRVASSSSLRRAAGHAPGPASDRIAGRAELAR
jgi:mxaJ protein